MRAWEGGATCGGCSPFLFDGYFHRPDLNATLFDAEGFFDTGDVGYLDDDGHLYVTGRRKDLVIIGGRNVYPTDVEEVVAGVDGVPMAQLETEGLVVLAESSLDQDAWKDLERRIRRQVPTQLDLDLTDVRIVERGRLRKSTSGKLARAGNREWYLAGEFGEPPHSIRRG